MQGAEEAYYIRRRGKAAQGPFEVERIRRYVAEGRVRAEMEFSSDQESWFKGTDWPDMFPAAVPAAPAASPPPIPKAPPPPAPAPARSRGAVPVRDARPRGPERGPATSRAGRGTRRPAPRRRSNAPMLAIIGLVVVGAVVAVYFLATHVSEKERAVQRVIELMEQGCELLEESPDESMDLSTAARFLKLVTELQEIEEEFGTMRSRMSDRALDAKYGAKLKALVKRMERATERRRAAGG